MQLSIHSVGVLIWGNTSKTLLKPIHLIQKKFVRMATYNDFYPDVPGPLSHTPPLFHKLNILTIFDIFRLQLAQLVFDSTNNIGPSSGIIHFIRINEIHQHETRSSTNENLHINFSRTTRYGLKNLQNAGSKLWASIPYCIKCKPSKISFKKKTIKDF